MPPMLALTGATGFIGSTIARRLQTAGWQIRILCRPKANLTRLDGIAVEQVEGTLEDTDSLHRLADGVQAVVHCAGIVRGASREQFEKVNAAGVARLVEVAARQRPPPRFLLISSLAAREPALSAYSASKRHGEEILARTAGAMGWTALRPPAVYGPGDRELLPLWQWMGRGIAPVLGPAETRFSLLYVEDLAEAVLAWLERGVDARRAFELHDGHPRGYSWSEVIATVANLYKRRVRCVAVPATLLGLVTVVNLAAARILGYAPMLTPGKLLELRHTDWVCDNAEINRTINWTPRTPLEEGLRRTLNLNHYTANPLRVID